MISVGSDDDVDLQAFLPAVGRAEIRVFNTLTLPSGGASFARYFFSSVFQVLILTRTLQFLWKVNGVRLFSVRAFSSLTSPSSYGLRNDVGIAEDTVGNLHSVGMSGH